MDSIAEVVGEDQGFDPATSERVFTLLADNYLEMVALGPMLARLADIGPNLGLQNILPETLDYVTAMRDMKVDAALYFKLPKFDKIDKKLIGHARVCVVCREGHPRIKEAITQAQYKAEKHVFLEDSSTGPSLLEQGMDIAISPAKIKLFVHNFTAMASVVKHTDLLGTMPLEIARLFQQAMGLRILSFPFKNSQVPIWLFWPSALNNDPGHGWFIQFLIEANNGSQSANQ
ncbi:LysR substrate-binding domain-containing protein [Halioxenophilus sp. WMMB6]|uniref:LysR substrate-binding domain-containing protein n=1 Tax=Halioxenophilus sp. WMMB6 TaxID=3073815 RepID=UPI00295E5677|nr:LysR substrate-binding domain-containing protein [Halioxenophilus sp. WMMB6]